MRALKLTLLVLLLFSTSLFAQFGRGGDDRWGSGAFGTSSGQDNSAPVIDAIPDTTHYKNIEYAITITATDPDGTIPTMSILDTPTGGVFVDNGDGTASFTWTPGSAQEGVHTPSFVASDGALSDTVTVTITVIQDPWVDAMMASYIILHTTLPAGVEDELTERLQPGEYLYTTFGPDGTDETICDFVLGFASSATTTPKSWTKSGIALRWDWDGTVASDTNTMPAHTGAGIVTVSTVDGWSGVTIVFLYGNPLVGQLPNLYNTGFTGITHLYAYISSLSVDIADLAGLTSMQYLHAHSSLAYGDLADIASLSSLKGILLNSTSVSDVSGAFVNVGLVNLRLDDLTLSSTEVDQVLADYVNVHNAVGLDLTKAYVINLGGTNAAPSATGLEYISTLKALDWATGGGSITITVSGVAMFYTMTTTAQSTANFRLNKTGTSVIVNWGDGTIEAVSKVAFTTHNYASPYTGGIVYYTNDGNAITYFYSTDNKYKFNVSSLPAGLTTFRCTGLNTISAYTAGRVWANNMNYVSCLPAIGSGLDATEVDNLLIDLANVATWTGDKIINIAGNNATRTAASDVAVNTLRVTKGVTVTVNE